MRKRSVTAVLTIVALITLASNASAWALNNPPPPSNTLLLTPGTTQTFCESAQNMVGEHQASIVLRMEIMKEGYPAKFIKTNYDDDIKNDTLMHLLVPWKEHKKPWCIEINVPENETIGAKHTILIKAMRLDEEKREGQLVFTTGQVAKIFLEFKEGGEPEQLQPPTPEGTITNKTQDISYDLTHIDGEKEEVSKIPVIIFLVTILEAITLFVVVMLYKGGKKSGRGKYKKLSKQQTEVIGERKNNGGGSANFSHYKSGHP